EVFDGVLSENAVAAALHTLGRSASGTECVYLHLSLSYHLLTDIRILDKYVHLEKLDLSNNKIRDLSCVSHMPCLLELDVSHNALTTYFDFSPPRNLQVSELSELEYIESLPLLRVFNLLKNPVQEQEDYWLLVIFMLLRLTELDHQKISVEEKVRRTSPSFSFSSYSTLPSLDAPYPMLVLTGPLACWKRELCHRLCRKFNNYFRYSPCHTTRSPYFGEENRLDYYYVSQEEFDKMVNTGKFIATFKYSGFHYGLSREVIESIAREGLATCVHLEIEGVRSLKNSYFEPRYILLIPVNKEKYGGHLRRMGLFSRPEIEEALRRVDMYTRMNQDFPGFFDAAINVDDYDEAFSKLSGLVEEFLGLVPTSESKAAVPAVGGKDPS
ncbi:leucine-rich repeat and guanylate kinase domain-containing protein-like, partial [Protobothrops mucrosquamatus]|uniref:leucine-rich repeat and guanylate kinase domain-containing protein-like n=1 Tax=Protobothrops mucrosquamatus TaxID=103944 RepID=UPI0007759D00